MSGNSLYKIKMTLFVVISLALILLSFHGGLDELALESVAETTNQSILILAMAGAVDAAISFFQEAEVPVLRIPVGELLAPVNDMVERLLSVMVWAVGSLALQRIVIEVSSSFAFKWAFFGIGIIAITTWLLGTWQRIRELFGAWDGFSALLVRIFIYLAVFRFIVPVFAIISLSVGHLLFDAEIAKSKEDLSLVGAGISVDANGPLPGTPEFEEQRAEKVSELNDLQERMALQLEEAEALDARIQELKRGVGLRQYLPGSLGGGSSDERQALKESGIPELDELLARMASYAEQAEALDARIRELKGPGLRQYLPERLGGVSPDKRSFTPSGIPELDELLERIATYEEEAEALDARIQELRGPDLRQYLPERLGGVSHDERTFTPSGIPELDELLERMASHIEEAEALDARIQELKGPGLRQYLPERLGGVSPDKRSFTPSGIPELDELLERMASHMEEAEALDARIQELRGPGLRQYLPERLGGVSSDERTFTPSGIPELDELLERMASHMEEAEALDARIQELKGPGLRQYLPERLGGVSPDKRSFTPSGIPELDELLERMASHMEEAEALDARIQELKGPGLRQYLPERLGGVSPDERTFTPSGIPELDELLERMATYEEEAEALDARVQELSDAAGLRQYLPESLGGLPPGEELSTAEARREAVSSEMETIETRIRVMEEELLATAEARREAVDGETEAIAGRIRALEGELLTTTEARRGAVSGEMEAIEGRIRAMEGELLAQVEARREAISSEMEAIESRIRAMEGELLAPVEARREAISSEMEAIESRIRAVEEELAASAEARLEEVGDEMRAAERRILAIQGDMLESAEARREEIRREMEAVEDRIGYFEGELLSAAETSREAVSGEIETAAAEIRVVEEELECLDKRSAGDDCVSLLGNLSAMAQEGYARIRDLVGRAGEIVTTMVKLMIFVIVKNILLPIVFLMIAVKCALPVARYGARLTSEFRRDVKELVDTVSPGAGRARLEEKSEGV